jgi:beta-galactosidase
MAHILPHWTFSEDRIGEITPVHVHTSGDEAELFVNGISAGRQSKGKYDYRLRWDGVQYRPGNISVVAYKNGEEWARASQFTAGSATTLNVTADRTTIAGDGYDLSFITVSVLDENGIVVPDAADEISFEVTSGQGVIVATDNGDPTDMRPFPESTRNAFSGMALAIVRSEAGASGEIVVEAKAEGLEGGRVVLTAS